MREWHAVDIQLLLRRIALGLPFVAAPVAGGVILGTSGCSSSSGGFCMAPPFTREISTEQRALLDGSGDRRAEVCRSLCESPAVGLP